MAAKSKVPWVAKPRTNPLNTVVAFTVTWDRKKPGPTGKTRTGNSWPMSHKATAERIYRQMLAEGRNPEATMEWCGGWL